MMPLRLFLRLLSVLFPLRSALPSQNNLTLENLPVRRQLAVLKIQNQSSRLFREVWVQWAR